MSDRKPTDNPTVRDANEPHVDPYGPASRGYAERHRVTSYEILPGLVREDIGGVA